MSTPERANEAYGLGVFGTILGVIAIILSVVNMVDAAPEVDEVPTRRLDNVTYVQAYNACVPIGADAQQMSACLEFATSAATFEVP